MLDAVAGGNAHAFDVLVARYGARVKTYLRHLLRDEAWAEDLTQEVFVKVYCRIDTRRAERSFAVWLFRIARNEALDFLRRRRLHQRMLDRVADGVGPIAAVLRRRRPPTPLSELEGEELSRALELAVDELPEPQRSVFVLRDREDLSYEEIADVVGCSPKTVSTRLHRARARLRQQLAERLGGALREGGAT